ncbi:thioredoxin domain-containing protein [Salegentibacter sp. UBA1130]|uniref:thioredoxin domain-containing protein n=1 Tax=Salegentibacter sp. UBA1130 TaxID=1947451 RepID=UPI00257B670B|nr:thioredoxin domain-containing protein [Salegentibacter sp. UBA1130]
MKLSSLASILLAIFLSISCVDEAKNNSSSENQLDKEPEEHEFTNMLVNESSPYLLQHAHNPVNWHPWSEETINKAKKENKLLVISIGYAACHWCHVMEEESFEDPEVAELMNENFISVKVDREERPDVDNLYMNAAQLMTGSGGWPLNVLALPDGKPFYAGTYYPKEDWLKILKHFVKLNKEDPEAILEQAEKITDGIQSLEQMPIVDKEKAFSLDELETVYTQLKSKIDFEKGGKVETQKFPVPVLWKFLLHYNYLTDDPSALEAVDVTLENMAFGGIYDQLGGGFARYSTDEDWFAPHFEKMLYDNAQLIGLYSQAWQKTRNPLYKDVVYESLEFVERELTAKNGAFYSSLDADTDGEEGKFYVWTADEIDEHLGGDSSIFKAYYNVEENGNWEDEKNILHREKSDKAFAEEKSLSVKELKEILSEGKQKLLNERQKRTLPALDDKVLTSWNALMIKAYLNAYKTFDEKRFLEAALKNARFLNENVIAENGALTRNYKDGKTSIPGFLDDYAFVISAFIDLYQATFDEKWLFKAQDLANYTKEHFFDSTSGMFFYTHDDHSGLISRQKEILDNVIPSSNSEMAKNLLILGHYFYDSEKKALAEQMLLNVQKDLKEYPDFYANWAIVEALLVKPPFEVAIVGKEHHRVKKEINHNYLPNVLLMGGEKEGNLELLKGKFIEGQTTIYVCKDHVCKFPVTTAREALEQINESGGFW